MANRIISFKEFSPSSGKQYFFDTNIWMLLYCPLGNVKKEKQDKASKLFSYILSANVPIILTSLILAEFSNAYLRLAFEQWRKLPENVSGKFKINYFDTTDASANREAISSAINNMLNINLIQKFPDNFHNINLSNILTNYKTIDFNDSFIIESCIKNSWILVTDDGDFNKIDFGISIVNL
ncbi:MAG TPA: PIN domain-containing protein [Chitinophagaceae bacterium]|jgi:PIN domain.